jgi:hypothetical protein
VLCRKMGQRGEMSDDTKPKRIQRKRTRGWSSPHGAIYVGRPTRWGNPFGHAQRFAGLESSLRCYRMAVEGIWDPNELKDMPDGPFQIACKEFAEFTKRFQYGATNTARAELRGKDLICWCRLDQPCHADILLEIANS